MSSVYKHAKEYEQIQNGRDYEEEVDFIHSKFVQHFDSNSQDVLILGCGPGHHSKFLSDYGHNITGIDKQKSMVKLAKRKSSANFFSGSFPNIPVKSNFDVVLLPYGIINHLSIEELHTGIAEVSDILNDNGILMFDNVEKKRKVEDLVMSRKRNSNNDDNHKDFKIQKHDNITLEKMLESNKFEVQTEPSPIGINKKKKSTFFTAIK